MLARTLVALLAVSAIFALWAVLLFDHPHALRARRPVFRLLLVLALGLSTLTAGVSEAVFVDALANAANAFTTTTIAPPANVEAAPSVSDVKLTWTATASTNASGYRVFRGTSSGGPYSQIAQLAGVSTTSYTDAPGDGKFYYAVRAYYDANGANWYSADSNEVTAMVGNQTFVFKSTDANTASGCPSAQRQRDMEQNFTPTDPEETIARTGGTGTISFCSVAFKPGQTLSAGTTTVRAYFRNTSLAACTVTATLYANETTSVGGASVSVNALTLLTLHSWSFNTTALTFTENTRLNLRLSWGSTTSCDGTYLHYDGEATPSRVTVPWISPPDTDPPAAPTGLTATAGGEGVILDWADNAETDLASVPYRVYRQNADGTWPSAPTATAATSGYTDADRAAGTTYTYRVTAIDRAGNESPPSAEASATPTNCLYDDRILSTGGLVSYWRLGETSGTTAADAQGGNDGTYTNGPRLGQTGLLTCSANKSVKLDGENDHVAVPDAALIDLTNQFTVEAWVNLDALPGSGTHYIVAKPGAYYLSVTGTTPTWRFGFEPTLLLVGGGEVASATGPTSGETYHVVGTYDGSTLRLYVNGVLAGSTSETDTVVTTANALRIGSYDGTSGFVNGRIDEVAVYSAALTAAQVSDHYDNR